MASKWRLNKKEEKQINEEAATFFQEKLDEGKSKTEAQKAKEDFVKTRTTEMKQAKADANSLKKKAAAAESATGSSTVALSPPSHVPAVIASNNQAYFQDLQKALAVVVNHPDFKGIETASPLVITEDSAMASGCQAL